MECSSIVRVEVVFFEVRLGPGGVRWGSGVVLWVRYGPAGSGMARLNVNWYPLTLISSGTLTLTTVAMGRINKEVANFNSLLRDGRHGASRQVMHHIRVQEIAYLVKEYQLMMSAGIYKSFLKTYEAPSFTRSTINKRTDRHFSSKLFQWKVTTNANTG